MRQLFVFLLLPIFSFAQTNTKDFVIKASIKGLKDSTQVSLKGGTAGTTIANTIVRNGQFTIIGKLKEADVFQLSFNGYKEGIDLFLFNDTLQIVGDLTTGLNMSGSQLQVDYEYFKQQFNPFRDRLNALAAAINQEKDATKRNGLMNEFNTNKTGVIQTAADFAKLKPNSPVSPFVLYVISPLFEGAGGILLIEPSYKLLTAAAKTSAYSKTLEKAIDEAKLGAIGSMAIPFSQKDTEGKLVSLASFKGKYVLVDFWASWCGPCRQENPNVVRAFNRFKAKNFTVLGISLDQDKSRWLQAIKDDGLTWTHLSDLQYWSNAVAQLYKIQSIPANMLIDPAGKIIGKNLRGEELIQTLATILK
jgi:peroxiredoxin